MENIEQRSGDDRRDDTRSEEERRAAVTSNREASLDLETATFKATGKSFEIRSIETNDDGSVDLALELDDSTKKTLCKTFGWDRVTEERLQSLVLDALDWHIKNNGGVKASTDNKEQESAAE